MTTNKGSTHMVSNGPDQLCVVLHNKAAGKAETVLLLHGGPGVPDDFPFVVQALTAKYHVITFDQRGTGASPCPSGKYSMDDYISDIEAIAKHFELSQFHLWGHSWGGLYAQIYAQAHPERPLSLFLSSPASGTNTLWKSTESEVLAYNRSKCASGWEFLKMGWYSLWGALGYDSSYQSLFLIVLRNYNRNDSFDKTSIPAITPDMVKGVKAPPINGSRDEIVKYPPLSLPMTFSRQFPIIITYGDADIYGPSQDAVRQRFPSAKHVVISQCGHMPFWHNPKAYQQILEEFYNL